MSLELNDIQGLIARGYVNLPAASYILLQLDNPSLARTWLAHLDITSGEARPSEWALNVALGPAGLRKLGVAEDTFSLLSYEFRTGMVTPHRQRMFGDAGDSAPEQWLWGGPATPTVDVLLLVFARDADTLQRQVDVLSGSFRAGGVADIVRLETTVDLDGREHFGFADGISQPTIAGLSSRVDTPPNTVAAGEFILGYPNEYGDLTDRPLVDANLGRNGTYLVFRQLRQDVHGFWAFVDQAVGGDVPGRERLAAKMVGRWRSGAPITLSPRLDDPLLAQANDFTYHYGDEFGLNCPLGSHVRRSHPRDALEPDPGTARSVALDKRHRLLRRGREYGPPVADPFGPPDDIERGLYFICLTGNIARQFEFVQHTWLNNPKFVGLTDEIDPLVGNHAVSGATFTIPEDPVRRRYHGLPNFVTVRGGGYFFLPGLDALQLLAQAEGFGVVQPGNSSSPVGS
jgi:Dyp-type peroxidase family